ncbi:MAG: acylphosphatase, partial [Nanoarchaeota archaeon]
FSGIVQDIFFRAFIKENAEKFDIKGFVRNLEDGRVEAFFEGNQDEIERVIELCKNHKQAKIDNIEIKEEKFQDLKGFKILHI